MLPFPFRAVRLPHHVGFLALLAVGLTAAPAWAQQPARRAAVASYPAGPGFNAAGSDARAIGLADTVMQAMGGYQNWQQTRFLAWEFFGEQYQVWDKHTGDFHWQKGDLSVNYNLNTRTGKAYKAGQDISATEEGQKLLTSMYAVWANNSWWLIMPFKLKDSGVTLTYKGPAQTQIGAPAQVLQLTFEKVGVTPENRYEILVNPKTGLVEEWAFFRKASDPAPSFRRQWTDYRRYGQIVLAADRTDGKDGRRLQHLAARQTVPAGLMQSPTPVAKLE
ncbi:hypothetical protein GCM10027048_21320 [Hymenobacter coalescens]